LFLACNETTKTKHINQNKININSYVNIDTIVFNDTYLKKLFTKKYVRSKNDTIRKVVLNKLKFNKCLFTQDNIAFDSLTNVVFEDCNFASNYNVDLRVLSVIDNVEFINCTFNTLSVKNNTINKGFKFTNCKANEILFDQTKFEDVSFIALSDTIKNIRIQSCSNSINLNFTGNINNVYLEGGEIKYLDVANITNPNSKLTVFSTYLINPNFVNKSAKNYSILFNSSIENASFIPDKSSILKEELEWHDKNSKDATETERTEIKKGYLISKSVYSYLTKVFETEKKYDLADYFYYRSKICEREINSDGIKKTILKFFNENIRGNYGTNYLTILKTFLFITLLFSFLYYILGYFKFAFGYYVKTKLFGETSDTEKPVLLTYHRNKFGFITFIINCFIFSLNNMVLGGLSNGFHFYNFTTMYLYPPRKYGTIGVGRIFSIFQSLIGLILVFFFITSFLRLTR